MFVLSTRFSWYTFLAMEQDSLDAQIPAMLSVDRQIGAVIESLLFVSGRPLQWGELRKLIGVDGERLTAGAAALGYDLESQQRGIRLQRLGDQVQLVTAPEHARYVAALLGLPMTAKLTPA